VRTHWEPEKNEKKKIFSIVGENINFKIFFLSLRKKIKKGKNKFDLLSLAHEAVLCSIKFLPLHMIELSSIAY